MDIKDIPLIITNFQQLTYLRNLINQFRFFYPENPIGIVDNGSTHKPLLEYYHTLLDSDKYWVKLYDENDFINNLTDYLTEYINWEYAVISDPDISIPFTTFPKFLEVFKAAIDSGFHHAGFGLRIDNIPDWNKKKGWIQGDEKAFKSNPVYIGFNGQTFEGWKAPIDTTLAMYKRDNGGWQCPQTPENWSNSVRIFEAEHLPWFQHPDYINDEMRNYYATCKRFVAGELSSGKNNYRAE